MSKMVDESTTVDKSQLLKQKEIKELLETGGMQELRLRLYEDKEKKLNLYYAANMKILEKRVVPLVLQQKVAASKDTLLVFIRILTFEIKNQPSYLSRVIQEGGISNDNIEHVLFGIAKLVISKTLQAVEMIHVLKFLTIITSSHLEVEPVANFLADYVLGLQMCLHLSQASIKNMLIEH